MIKKNKFKIAFWNKQSKYGRFQKKKEIIKHFKIKLVYCFKEKLQNLVYIKFIYI